MSAPREREPVANGEHLVLLRRGNAVWNKWRERNPNESPDLSLADLSEAHLNGADLRGADLRGANLREADLGTANLREADLSDTNLIGANLIGANLIGARLIGARLIGARLIEANLIQADLSLAKLIGADLSWARLLRANLSQANLFEANLTRADLTRANLSEASLSCSNLRDASLQDTIFGAVDLTGTNGLNECSHRGPSVIDFRTLFLSQNLSITFQRGCGLPDNLIDYLPSLRGDAIQFYSCFISYSTKDQVFADMLHADLQNKGVRCWFAPHDLSIGAKTWDAIDEAIRLRDKLLLILSKASITSDWVEDEVSKAFAEERERNTPILFPIRIDDAVLNTREPWARKLRDQRNIGDFRQWEARAEYLKNLDGLLRDLTI
jgi:uncharacterized protein YjbI with pentapeptide repeats